jgi:NAD(P)H-nitrite reductase large subunit/ferredoxin
VSFLDGPEVATAVGVPLLEVIERAGLPIESGCRMGVCGADPVTIVEGADRLSPVEPSEASTLERLGLSRRTRLACRARVQGACTVSLTNERADSAPDAASPGATVDLNVRRLVIVGNGITGATAADHARRLHPGCEIHLVGMEPHRLYNRMAISRLIHGRSAMQGLYLVPESWYQDNDVTCWLNTRVRAVDPAARTVALATGERLEYDRLILATGSRSAVPDIDGIDLPGSFTLRRAEDAIAMRAFVQDHHVRTAVVAGGGLLGLESAYALHKLGIATTVLERGPWLMRRQLDEPAARLLERYLNALGMTVVNDAAARSLTGDARVEGVVLTDGRTLPSRLFLACPGIVPNTELAAEAGLAVHRGVLVDDHLRTSDPHVFAAGEVAELAGQVSGLWPMSAAMGEVAAVNAIGGDRTFAPAPPTTMLKVVGVDVASIGAFEGAGAEDVVVVVQDDEDARYRKLVIRDGAVVGAILVGAPHHLPAVQRAVESRTDVRPILDELRRGSWDALALLAGEGLVPS